METVKISFKVNFQQIVEAVKQLSPKEKLKLNDIIWADEIEIPLNTQKIVLDRMEKARLNPDTLLDWEVVSKTLIP